MVGQVATLKPKGYSHCIDNGNLHYHAMGTVEIAHPVCQEQSAHFPLNLLCNPGYPPRMSAAHCKAKALMKSMATKSTALTMQGQPTTHHAPAQVAAWTGSRWRLLVRPARC